MDPPYRALSFFAAESGYLVEKYQMHSFVIRNRYSAQIYLVFGLSLQSCLSCFYSEHRQNQVERPCSTILTDLLLVEESMFYKAIIHYPSAVSLSNLNYTTWGEHLGLYSMVILTRGDRVSLRTYLFSIISDTTSPRAGYWEICVHVSKPRLWINPESFFWFVVFVQDQKLTKITKYEKRISKSYFTYGTYNDWLVVEGSMQKVTLLRPGKEIAYFSCRKS